MKVKETEKRMTNNDMIEDNSNFKCSVPEIIESINEAKTMTTAKKLKTEESEKNITTDSMVMSSIVKEDSKAIPNREEQKIADVVSKCPDMREVKPWT